MALASDTVMPIVLFFWALATDSVPNEKAGLASTPAELKKFTWDHNYGTGIAALPITETGTDLPG